LIVEGDDPSYDAPSVEMSTIGNFLSIYVENNQYVTFGVTATCGANAIVTVRNIGFPGSGTNIVLDTFNINHYGEC
jgi:hypothetical protein